MICPILCQYLCNELTYILLCLSRIKGELSASQNTIKTICQDRLKAREKAICYRLVLVILATITFTKSVIPLGQCTESVFNLLFQVYRSINMITKHFLVRSTFHEPVYKQALLSIIYLNVLYMNIIFQLLIIIIKYLCRMSKLSEIVNNQLSPNVSKFIMFVEVCFDWLN